MPSRRGFKSSQSSACYPYGACIRPTAALADGLNSLFYCWVRRIGSGEYREAFVAEDPEKYFQVDWREFSYTEFASAKLVKPPGVQTVSLRSKQTFSYGIFEVETRLKPMVGGPLLWFGFEVDDLFRGGVAHFLFDTSRKMLFGCVGRRSVKRFNLPLPTGYDSTRNSYTVVVRRGMVLHLVNGVVKAVTEFFWSDSSSGFTVYDGPPYLLNVVYAPPPPSMPVLIDIDGAGGEEYVWEDLHPWLIRVTEGDPRTPISLPLSSWGTGVKWRDTAVSSGGLTSAPIPGVGRKTLIFVSDCPGRLKIQMFLGSTGLWFDYREISVREGEVCTARIEEDGYAYRFLFTPSRYPGRVVEASVLLE